MRKLLMAAMVTALAAGLTSTVAAQSEGSSITVSVSSDTAIDMAPDSFSYSLDPGTFNDTSANDYNGVEIENTGSVNITDIYMTTSQPSERPFGTGTPGSYDAGNFIQIQPTTEKASVTGDNGEGFTYVSRKDFNESNDLSYFDRPSGASDARYGRLRVANESFFWAIDNPTTGGSQNGCDGSGTSTSNLYVGENPHSETVTGSVDFTQSGERSSYTVAEATNDNYGIVDTVTLDTYQGTDTYTFLTWCGNSGSPSADNSTHVIATRWNPEHRQGSGQYGTASGSLEKLLSTTVDADTLHPGEHFSVLTRTAVPNGVANGNVGSGTLTVNVAANN